VDLLALVAAIPVTYLYRAIAGVWPSATADGVLLESTLLQHIKGIAVPVLYIIAGVLTALNDFLLITTHGFLTTGVMGKIVGGILLLLSAANTVYTVVQHPDWGLALVTLGNLYAMVLLVLGPIKLGDKQNSLASWCNCLISPLNIAYYAAWIDREESITKLISDVLGQVPAFVNPIRFAPPETPAPYIAPVANLVFRLAQAGLTLADTITGWNQVAESHAQLLLAGRYGSVSERL
jgi:hypothetical protein